MWLWKSEQIADVVPSTMNCTDPRGESDLSALSRTILVDVCNMIWTVSSMKVDYLRHRQTKIVWGRNERSARESLRGRRRRNPLRHGSAHIVGCGRVRLAFATKTSASGCFARKHGSNLQVISGEFAFRRDIVTRCAIVTLGSIGSVISSLYSMPSRAAYFTILRVGMVVFA